MAEPLGVVLAGGRGRRLGGAKADAVVAGLPLVDRPIGALRAAGLDVVVVAKAGTRLPALGVPVILEPDVPVHPLTGIVAALEYAGRDVVICAGDMPFVPVALLARLAAAESPELVVAGSRGGPEPLLGRYCASLLAELRDALSRECGLRDLVRSLGPRARVLTVGEMAAFGEPDLAVRDIDTPDDLAQAARLLGGDDV